MRKRGKRLAPGEAYSGRRPDIAVLNLSMPREEAELVRSYAGGKKMGQFVAGLVRAYHATRQERQRLRAVLHGALDESTAG